jgi:hypothetical protein
MTIYIALERCNTILNSIGGSRVGNDILYTRAEGRLVDVFWRERKRFKRLKGNMNGWPRLRGIITIVVDKLGQVGQ